MRNTLITGVDIATGVYLAAELQLLSANAVYLMLQSRDADLEASAREHLARLVRQKATDSAKAGSQPTERTVKIIGGTDKTDLANILREHQVGQIWFLASPSLGSSDHERSAKFALDLAAALLGSGVSHFRYVRPFYAAEYIPSPAGDIVFEPLEAAEMQRHRIVEDQLPGLCSQAGVEYRMFCIPAIVGECHYSTGRRASGFSSFLVGLHEYKAEIEERFPDYFEYQALRCFAPDESYLNLISAESAVVALLNLAHDGDKGRPFNQIVAPQSVRFSELCTRIGMVYGLSLLTVANTAELNAIDQIFNERVAGLRAFLTSGPGLPIREHCRVTLADESSTSRSRPLEALGEIRKLQDGALRERNQQAEVAGKELELTTALRNDLEIRYFRGGFEGTPVILLNALGQGLRYWNRLLFELRKRHRVIIWEPRTMLPGKQVVLSDYADDLEAILQIEGIEECHLVAWCTGPKVAINFCFRHPEAVVSMVFLNAAFKSTSTAHELVTDYEEKLEPLLRLLDRSPAVAGVVMRSLRECARDAAIPDPAQLDIKEMALRVLSLTNIHLLTEVIAPFQSQESTVNYARQVLDFYACDISEEALKINVPVLLIGAEHDKIASPKISRVFAGLFSRGRYVEIKGATHYCLYDCAPFLASLMEDFFETNKQLVINRQESPDALACSFEPKGGFV